MNGSTYLHEMQPLRQTGLLQRWHLRRLCKLHGRNRLQTQLDPASRLQILQRNRQGHTHPRPRNRLPLLQRNRQTVSRPLHPIWRPSALQTPPLELIRSSNKKTLAQPSLRSFARPEEDELFFIDFCRDNSREFTCNKQKILNKSNKNRYNKGGTYNLTIYRVLADAFSRCKNSDCSSHRSRSYSFCLKREIVGSSRRLGGCNFY